jgi:hypothetical protein
VFAAGADLQSVPIGIRQNGTGYKPAPARVGKKTSVEVFSPNHLRQKLQSKFFPQTI